MTSPLKRKLASFYPSPEAMKENTSPTKKKKVDKAAVPQGLTPFISKSYLEKKELVTRIVDRLKWLPDHNLKIALQERINTLLAGTEMNHEEAMVELGVLLWHLETTSPRNPSYDFLHAPQFYAFFETQHLPSDQKPNALLASLVGLVFSPFGSINRGGLYVIQKVIRSAHAFRMRPPHRERILNTLCHLIKGSFPVNSRPSHPSAHLLISTDLDLPIGYPATGGHLSQAILLAILADAHQIKSNCYAFTAFEYMAEHHPHLLFRKIMQVLLEEGLKLPGNIVLPLEMLIEQDESAPATTHLRTFCESLFQFQAMNNTHSPVDRVTKVTTRRRSKAPVFSRIEVIGHLRQIIEKGVHHRPDAQLILDYLETHMCATLWMRDRCIQEGSGIKEWRELIWWDEGMWRQLSSLEEIQEYLISALNKKDTALDAGRSVRSVVKFLQDSTFLIHLSKFLTQLNQLTDPTSNWKELFESKSLILHQDGGDCGVILREIYKINLREVVIGTPMMKVHETVMALVRQLNHSSKVLNTTHRVIAANETHVFMMRSADLPLNDIHNVLEIKMKAAVQKLVYKPFSKGMAKIYDRLIREKFSEGDARKLVLDCIEKERFTDEILNEIARELGAENDPTFPVRFRKKYLQDEVVYVPIVIDRLERWFFKTERLELKIQELFYRFFGQPCSLNLGDLNYGMDFDHMSLRLIYDISEERFAFIKRNMSKVIFLDRRHPVYQQLYLYC